MEDEVNRLHKSWRADLAAITMLVLAAAAWLLS